MKKMKKLAALFLAVVMVMAMGMTAMAAPQSVPTGKDGDATITIVNPKAGKEYTVYKLFDAKETGEGDTLKIAYTLLDGQTAADLEGTGLTADANGNVTAEDEDQEDLTPDQVEALKTLALTTGKSEKVAGPVESNGEKLVFTGLPYGYYVVVSGVGAAVSIDSTAPNMEIYDKNPNGPGPDPDGKTKEADDKLVQVGGEAHYTVSFATTNYETTEIKDNPATEDVESGVKVTKIYQYTVTDKVPKNFLTNITVDSVIVYDNEAARTAGNGTPISGLSFLNGVMTINWTSDGTANGTHLYKDGSILEIKYHGTVNNNIADGQSGNTNKVTIDWNDSENPFDDEEDVYTASVIIDKTNGTNGPKLNGATFVLLDTEVPASGPKAGEIPDNANFYEIDAKGNVTKKAVSTILGDDGEYNWPDSAKKTTMTVDGVDGKATFPGLKADTTYHLLEIEAPAGFNKLVGTTPVVIGKVLTEGNGVTADDVDDSIVALNQTATVVNNAGTVLPSTGGIGTTIFYVVGGILVLGAAVLLITKKRMSARN